MLKLVRKGVYLLRGNLLIEEAEKINIDEINCRLTNAGLDPMGSVLPDKKKASKGTIAYRILQAHNADKTGEKLNCNFSGIR